MKLVPTSVSGFKNDLLGRHILALHRVVGTGPTTTQYSTPVCADNSMQQTIILVAFAWTGGRTMLPQPGHVWPSATSSPRHAEIVLARRRFKLGCLIAISGWLMRVCYLEPDSTRRGKTRGSSTRSLLEEVAPA